MKVRAIIVIFVFMLPRFLWAACGGVPTESPAGTWTTYDASRDCVNDAIQNYATTSETVVVADGDATWSTQIVIDKALTLVGGTGTITTDCGDYYAIKFQPSADNAFEIKDFTFSGKQMILIYNPGFDFSLTKIKIHGNTFTLMSRAIVLRTGGGPVYGVFYRNTVQSSPPTSYGEFLQILGDGDDDGSWERLTHEYGSANNFYIEDNNFIAGDLITYGGHGGRYVFRYNTVTFNTGHTEYANEMHGDGGSYGCGAMVTETYGNLYVHNAGLILFDQRGGWHLGFMNASNRTGTPTRVRDDFYGQTPNPCVHASNEQPNYVSNSYYWGSRAGDGDGALSTPTIGDGTVENVNFWIQRTGEFDGTGGVAVGGGVGCGTLAARPATCTTGVAYWATDQGNCSDLTGYVGANATKIEGKLYKCTATDTWTEYYTPYDYPHPLRTDEAPPSLTVTVTNTGSGHSPSHDGARTVQTGGSLTFTSGVFNGWKVAISGTCGCTTDGCTVVPAENCTITCTSSEIQLMPW